MQPRRKRVRFDVQLAWLGGTNFESITLPPFSTYEFDSQAQSWALGSADNSVQLFTTADGTVAVGLHGERHGEVPRRPRQSSALPLRRGYLRSAAVRREKAAACGD
ncbi:MAG TPA: hypothetical protein VI072_22835 [Polyangiaceae bacterium]